MRRLHTGAGQLVPDRDQRAILGDRARGGTRQEERQEKSVQLPALRPLRRRVDREHQKADPAGPRIGAHQVLRSQRRTVRHRSRRSLADQSRRRGRNGPVRQTDVRQRQYTSVESVPGPVPGLRREMRTAVGSERRRPATVAERSRRPQRRAGRLDRHAILRRRQLQVRAELSERSREIPVAPSAVVRRPGGSRARFGGHFLRFRGARGPAVGRRARVRRPDNRRDRRRVAERQTLRPPRPGRRVAVGQGNQGRRRRLDVRQQIAELEPRTPVLSVAREQQPPLGRETDSVRGDVRGTILRRTAVVAAGRSGERPGTRPERMRY